jgi:hypothetical protein
MVLKHKEKVTGLSVIPCTNCKGTKEEVLNYENRSRIGWYCPKCHDFTKAIGRERRIF